MHTRSRYLHSKQPQIFIQNLSRKIDFKRLEVTIWWSLKVFIILFEQTNARSYTEKFWTAK